MSARAPNVFSVPPGVSFAETLADALMDGRLVPGYAPGRDPLRLADATIFVPTRRFARALAATFVSRLDCDAALLPDIRPLGTTDLDEIRMGEAFGAVEPALGSASLLPVIDPMTRHVLLTRLVQTWWRALRDPLRDLYDGDITVPSSLADAAWFARDLGRLMDAMTTEEASWENLARIDPADTGRWWQLTTTFLEIATARWPEILAERGCMDSAERHARLVKAQFDVLREDASDRPIVAAGSTGSIPSTARLLAHVAHRPGGALVLPGLDTRMDDATWSALTEEGVNRETHPQFGLAQLLAAARVDRSLVTELGAPDEAMRNRARVVEEALRPADSTHSWSALPFSEFHREDAFEGAAYVEAANEREEAAAIALALREGLEEPDRTVALVTPDRNLARRVAIELERFAIRIDDSAGRPLRNTTWGRFAALVLRCAAEGAAADIAALVKHPLVRVLGPERTAKGARAFECLALRGALVPPVVGALSAHLRERPSRPGARDAVVVSRLAEDDRDAALELAEALDAALGSLVFHLGESEVPLRVLAEETAAALEALARPAGPEAQDETPWTGDDGEEMASLLSSLLLAEETLDVPPRDWPALLDAFMADRAVRSRSRTHPRAAIWGPLEARLMQVDRVVLGGLNEETWPASLRNDAFLSRQMKRALPLEPPERRIGLAAHDITMLFGHRDLVLTRSLREGTRPTVASRWWQRIRTLAGPVAKSAMQERGAAYLAAVRARDAAAAMEPCASPAPCPPLDVRPTRVSATEIERYVRDPYTVYARRILGLDPVDDLVREPDVAERGSLYHLVMERWTRSGHDPHAPDAFARMGEISDECFEEFRVPKALRATWRPRFDEIARDVLAWERERSASVVESHVEAWAEWDVGPFRVVARADRIDRLRDGTLAVLDYKTGSSPSKGQANTLLAPQLPVTAALAARGAFRGLDAADTSHLAYVRLRAGGFADEPIEGVKPKGENAPGPAVLAERAWQQLEGLARRFADPATPYLSRARPALARTYVDPYDHLARVKEWQLAEEGGEA